jgi:hypothetical protein
MPRHTDTLIDILVEAIDRVALDPYIPRKTQADLHKLLTEAIAERHRQLYPAFNPDDNTRKDL